jgi:hypothetical protein
VKATAVATKLGSDTWSVVVEVRDENNRVTSRQGSTVIGKEKAARAFARSVGGKGTKVTVKK